MANTEILPMQKRDMILYHHTEEFAIWKKDQSFVFDKLCAPWC